MKPIRINKTAHEEYGEPNDEIGKHLVCHKCGFCINCKDCKNYGCGNKNYKKTKEGLKKFGGKE